MLENISEKSQSRRNIIKGGAVGATVGAIAIASGTRATANPTLGGASLEGINPITLKAGKFHIKEVISGYKNTSAWINFIPYSKPQTGKNWYKRINSRVDGNSYYSLDLMTKGSDGRVALAIERRDAKGQQTTLKTVEGNAIITGELIEMRMETRIPSIKGWVTQNGKKILEIEVTENEDSALKGLGVSTSTYVGGSKNIQWAEDTLTVLPFDDRGNSTYIGPEWNLVFNDEFNGDSIDTSKWNVRDSEPFIKGVPNTWPSVNESSTTFDTARMVEVSNGTVKIRRKQLPKIYTAYKRRFAYETGYLDSNKKFEQKYGRWEIRSKQPARHPGSWGGFWLMSSYTGKDPYQFPKMEIDISEAVGANENHKRESEEVAKGKWELLDTVNRAMSTIHYYPIYSQTNKDRNGKPLIEVPQSRTIGRFSPKGAHSLEDEFHTWAVEVTPDRGIEVFFDGQMFQKVAPNDPKFVQYMKYPISFAIRLNLMSGMPYYSTLANSPEKLLDPNITVPLPEDRADLSIPLEIDYVRAWSYNGPM